MSRFTRGLLAAPLLVLTAVAGVGLAPAAAEAAGVPATVKVRTSLMVRSAATLDSGVVGTLHNGDTVTAACSVTGQTVRGSVRTTDLWNRLSSGDYVTDAYVWSP